MDFAQIVKACHIVNIKRKSNGFRFSGSEQSRLFICGKLSCRLAEPALRRAVIKLNYFSACLIARVFDIDCGNDFSVALTAYFAAERKACVRKTKAERISHIILCAGYCFKIAVADINIVRIVEVVKTFPKIFLAGVVII